MSTEADNNMDSFLSTKFHTQSWIGTIGNVYFEYMIQPSHENAAALENIIGIDEQTLRHQGSDFFGAPGFFCNGVGHIATLGLHKLSKSFLPEKATKAIEKYYPYVRSAVTLSMLGAYEGLQSVTNNKPYDFKDLAAYGLGMLVISNSYDLFQDARRFIDRKAPSDRGRISFPKPQNV